jgi:tetratricopeptide (TPR) repeat protein
MPKPIKRKIQQKAVGTEDEVLSYLDQLRVTAMERQSQLVKVIAVAVVVIAAVLVMYFVHAGSVKEARQLHYEGYKAFNGLYSYGTLSETEQAQKAIEYFLQSYGKKKTPQTLFYIANSHFRLGETDKGFETLDTLIREYPDAEVVPLARFRKGSEYLDAGQKEQALEVFDELGVMVGAPMSDMALMESARILEELGREEDAMAKYEAIVNNHPASPYFTVASQKTGADVSPGIDIKPLGEGGEGQPGIQIMPAEEGSGTTQQPAVQFTPVEQGGSGGETAQ